MALHTDELGKIAELARLRIEPQQLPALATTLDGILALVEQLGSVDTSGVEPLSNPLDASQPLRADAVTESNQRERFQAIAPAVEQGLYLVPRVIE